MLGTYSYNEIFRKTVVAFGTLFNNIELRRSNEVMKVPLAYGPKQKFLARLDQTPDPTNKRLQITLPRISFEINGISYDATRKVSPTQKVKVPKDGDGNYNIYMPVPYTLSFELAIISKTQEDGMQILEQILPFFQPHYNLSVKLLPTMNEIKDVPVILNQINYEDSYEGNFANRRAIIYTLQFSVKTYLYGPTREAKIIKTAQVDYYAETNVNTAPRVQRYSVVPTATQNLTGTALTTLSSAMDDSTSVAVVADATGLSIGDEFQIDSETFRVEKIDGNQVSVLRGRYTTDLVAHAASAEVHLIDSADAALLDADDDFGFGETASFFTDMKKYNPTSGNDEDL